MEQLQTIGNIKIDDTDYPGEDLYCDGPVEDELLEIAKNYSSVEFPQLIEERKSWPVLYHLSSQRENIVEWLPIGKNMKVLEIGSGCGAITGKLAEKAGSVTCVELSRKRSLINAYRHEECDNVTIKLGNFRDVEPKLEKNYDCAVLIGVLEYGENYIGGNHPYVDFIKTIRAHVKKSGMIVIAIENRFGMKYWAGCREDHSGEFFSSLEGYPDGGCARTFSKKELEQICEEAEEKRVHFYYPYPDYKFMTTLYSDDCLPKPGELNNNDRNFDRDRMKLFHEGDVFDGIVKEELFPFFSNSFLLVLGGKPKTEYVRYSNDRAPSYRIATEILKEDIPDEETGKTAKKRVVKKRALCNDAKLHIRNMIKMYPLLKDRYDDEKLVVNPLLLSDENSVTFQFEPGKTLMEYFDDLLKKGDMDGFVDLFMEYVERIGHNSQMLVTDYDAVFSNILVDGKKWKLIDYEWTYERQTVTKELAFRALYCYLLENEERNKLSLDLILQKLQITKDEADGYRERELRFQRTVTGKRKSMQELREMIGGTIVEPQLSVEKLGRQTVEEKIQIYVDSGSGFNEEESFFLEDYFENEDSVEAEFRVPPETKNLRIDPCMSSCMVDLQEISLNHEVLPFTERKFISANGKVLADDKGQSLLLIFGTDDPGFSFKLSDRVRSTENCMFVRMKITKLSEKTAETLEKELNRKIRLC